MVNGESQTNDATPDYRVQEEMVCCYDYRRECYDREDDAE